MKEWISGLDSIVLAIRYFGWKKREEKRLKNDRDRASRRKPNARTGITRGTATLSDGMVIVPSPRNPQVRAHDL